MSDLVIGALIAGGTAIFASGLTAFLAYRTTDRQVKSNMQQIVLTLVHDENEKRRDRLTEARKVYLIPLRETVSHWHLELIQLPHLSLAMKKLIQSTSDVNIITNSKVYQRVIEFNAHMVSLAQQHEALLGQVSDNILRDLINDALEVQGQAQITREGIFDSVDLKKDRLSLLNAIDESKEVLQNVKSKLINTNKRIEYLLCGEESE